MSEIIAFRPNSGASRRRRGDEPAAPAQILFFTGVRYSRMAESEPTLDESHSGARPAGGGRRRRG